MDILLFLLIVGFGAGGLFWFISRSNKKRDRAKARTISEQPVYSPNSHKLRYPHASPSTSTSHDIWATRRRHAGEEVRGSASLTARKIEFDDEPNEQPADDDVSMTPIEYTPEPVQQTSPKRN